VCIAPVKPCSARLHPINAGAIDAGIEKVMIVLKGKEIFMIPVLMILFAAGGTVFGMAEGVSSCTALPLSVSSRPRY
jgi:uncharacterized ion transporter superfamily protein YfcC